jgi:hypothetical protein
MAALVLSIAGAAAGSSVLGPIGAIVGRLVGAVAGKVIDQALFGARRSVSLEGPRLSDITVMASTEDADVHTRPKRKPRRSGANNSDSLLCVAVSAGYGARPSTA